MKIKNTQILRLVCVGLCLLIFAHCAMFKKEVKVKYPNETTPAMEADFERAEAEFREKKYSEAEGLYRNFLQTYPYNRLSDESDFRIGQILMLRQEYGPASERFSALMEKTPDPAVATRAAAKAGISQYRLKDNAKALHFFDKVEGQYLRHNDKIKVGGLAVVILDKTGASLERKGYYLALLLDSYEGQDDATIQKKYGVEAPPGTQVLNQLDTWAQTPATPGQIDRRFLSYQAGRSKPYIDFKLGMAYYNAGDTKNAKKYLGDLVNEYPNFSLAKQAAPLLAKIGYKEKPVKKGVQYKIGVILPLSGKYESFGVSTLSGMECAAGTKAGCDGVGNLQIVTRDDQGSPAEAVKAVQELVQQENVTVILGPLSSTSALAAAKKAQELGVVMISLAQKEGIPEVGDRIFRFSLTPNQQVHALLNYAVKKSGKKDLAVLHPDTNYGQVFRDEFKNLAPEYGAKVTAAQGYKNPNDVSGDLRQLKFGVSRAAPNLPLGFNGIFIPDSYVAILRILPHLKMAGMDQLLLLGTNAWNDANLATGSHGDLKDSIFLDIYFKDSKQPLVKSFIEKYQAAFGHSPTTLEAMGYDIVRYVGLLLNQKKVTKTDAFLEIMRSAPDYRGVTGLRSFGPNREAQIRPYMLTVKDNQIQEVED